MSVAAGIAFANTRPEVIAGTGNRFGIVHGVVRNITSYGADPAASAATNTAAIAAAAADVNALGGGVVYFPSGSFTITVPSLIFTSYTNVSFVGEGRKATLLVAGGSAFAGSPVDPGPGSAYGFFTFYTATNCHVTGIGFKGAGAWPPTPTPPTVFDRKGVMFRDSARCSVTKCYLESTEGESLYCDGTTVCEDIHYDFNEFKNCLSNNLNVGVATTLGKNCSASFNSIEGLVASAFQGGGINLSVIRNVVRPGVAQPAQGGDVFLLVNSIGARLEDNEIFDMDISQSGVSFFSVGDASGTAAPGALAKHVSVRGNKMTRCKINNTGAAKQGFIAIYNLNGTNDDIVVDGNVISEATSTGSGAIGIRVGGAGTGKVHVGGGNVIRPTSGLTIGVQVDADVPSGGVTIDPGVVFGSVVTTRHNLLGPTSNVEELLLIAATGATALTAATAIAIVTANGSVTATLFDPTKVKGKTVIVKNDTTQAGTTTVGTAAGNIDGVATKSLVGAGAFGRYYSDGTNWKVVG